jgi:hypothetical protein
MFPLNQATNGYKTIVGRRLARRLRSISPDYRALLAHELVAGDVVVHRLSQTQAAALVRVSQPYVSAVSRASPEEREQIKRHRLSLSALHNKRRKPSDDKLDRFIRRYGADRIMAALDRMTAPQRRAAE